MTARAPLFEAADPRGEKEWQHRARAPEDTCARLRPVHQVAGITRVADLTGLDRIGIPVFQAVRPLGRLLSVSQGKGETAVAARASAVMEAIEIWHAETERLPRQRSSRRAIADMRHMDPNTLLRPQAAKVSAYTPLAWTAGTDLKDGAPILVPADAANLDFTREPDLPELARSTTGLAGGNSKAEARASALAEIIERSCRVDESARSMKRQARRRLDPEKVARLDDRVAGLIGLILAAGLKLELADITNRFDVTTIRAAVFELPRGKPVAWPSHGFGTHLDPITAVIRALTEAAQARLTGISGNRDDIPPNIYQGAEFSNSIRHAFGKWDLSFDGRGLDRRDESGHAPERDAQIMLERILSRGAGPVAEVDLSRPEIGVPVVKLLAPNVAFLAVR